MAVNSAMGAMTRPRKRTVQAETMPSPISGIDGRIPISRNNPDICLYAFNVVPSEYGVQVRKGFREWQIDVVEGSSFGIGTIIPFVASDQNKRLFAATTEGIWDVTDEGGTPVKYIDFPSTSLGSGNGIYIQYHSDAGKDYIFYADEVNGLFRYDYEADNWEVPADITGVPVSTINYVASHKLRIWFGVQNIAIAYYLPINAIAGALEPFNFGINFKHGGELVALVSWTVDGGVGVDDYLIAISRGGDVLPYQGSDPTQIDWATTGTYWVGDLARGNRCVSQYGGNVTIISTSGITQLSDLLRGVSPELPNEASIGSRIASIVRNDMSIYGEEQGWSVDYLSPEGSILVSTPKRLNGIYLQYVFNISVSGWGNWRGVPMTCVADWNGVTYFGTEDGRICAMDVLKDEVKLTPEFPQNNGNDIDFSILFNYSNFGAAATFKRGNLIRPDFITTGPITFNTKFLYDYDISEIMVPNAGAGTGEAIWDTAIWDAAVWSDSSLEQISKVVGGAGIGRYVAIAIRGKALSDTVIASVDVLWTTGGNL